MPEEEEKDSICCSLFFQKVCVPVYNLQRLSPHLPLLQLIVRLFSMFTRPCQVSSPQFTVSHSCVSSLCFFSALINLLSILKPYTNNLFLTVQGFSKHLLLCSSLHHSDLPAAGWLLRMLSLRATLLAFC